MYRLLPPTSSADEDTKTRPKTSSINESLAFFVFPDGESTVSLVPHLNRISIALVKANLPVMRPV
jgi:hypothetical protein